MAKLHFSLEGNSLGEFTLDKERMTIGRRPANDIHIDNLAVSGEHAVITTIGNDSFLEDMNSTNGTLVNNKIIKKHVLVHNDVIELGKYQLLYINQSQAKAPVNNGGFANTVVMRPSKLDIAKPQENELSAKSSVEPELASPIEESNTTNLEANQPDSTLPQIVAETPIPSDGAVKIGRLQILSGANAGREMSLSKALTTLGKPGIQLAVVTKRPHGYFITHVEGKNLLLVNGQKIGLQAHALNDRDVIEVSGVKMEFFLS